jgi:hypothetical protein
MVHLDKSLALAYTGLVGAEEAVVDMTSTEAP